MDDIYEDILNQVTTRETTLTVKVGDTTIVEETINEDFLEETEHLIKDFHDDITSIVGDNHHATTGPTQP